MKSQYPSSRVALAVGSILLMGAAPLYAQDGLSRAKTFYASASYEEALGALTSLHGAASPAASTEVAMYEVFCLVALNRGDDARRVIEAAVRTDPEYHLTDEQASPRVRAMFDTFRMPLLPDIAREAYLRGRDAYDRKELTAALKEFDRVIALVGELEPTKDPGLRDMRTLALGFRDLGKAALVAQAAAAPPVAAPTSTPPAPSSTSAPAAAAPFADTRRTFGPADTDVKPPVALSQSLPPWRPETIVEKKIDYRGYVDLLIDDAGRVQSAAIVKSIHVRYDPILLEAARRWTFRPATKDGHPVGYRYTLEINLVQR